MNMPPRKKKVLIVDDDRSMLSVLRFLLHGVGLEVSTALSGEEGLDKLSNEQPDLIILDITMPGIDGLQFCEMVRNFGPRKEIPIIFLTARDKFSHIEKAFQLGAAEYLIKPVDHRKILELVKKHLPGPAGKTALGDPPASPSE